MNCVAVQIRFCSKNTLLESEVLAFPTLKLYFKEICCRPELSSPPRFRILGGSLSFPDKWTEILMSNIG